MKTFALSLILLLAGCAGDITTPEPDPTNVTAAQQAVAGTYDLQTMVGTSYWFGLPVSGTGSIVLQGGEYTMDVMYKAHPNIAAQLHREVGTYTATAQESRHTIELSRHRSTASLDADGLLVVTWPESDLIFRRR